VRIYIHINTPNIQTYRTRRTDIAQVVQWVMKR